MLARVTYGLVGVAAITLILGFFVTEDSNVLLYVSIGLSLLAIVLIIVGAARRAREAPAEAGAFREAGEPTDEEEIPADILSAFEDEDLEDYEEEYEPAEDEAFDEEDEELEEDEEDEEEEDEEEPAPRRAAAATKTKKKTQQKKKTSTSKKKAASKKKTAAKKSTGKVSVVPGRDRYHASDCRFVRDKDDVEELTKTSAKRRGYEPCSVCSPDD